MLSGRAQNKETYWVCFSKGHAALKREENRREGERKEKREKGGKRSLFMN